MFLRSLIFLSFFFPLAVAKGEESKEDELAKQFQDEIAGQLYFLKDTAFLPEEIRAEEQAHRARTLAELFFDKRLKSFRTREIVFQLSEKIVKEMQNYLEKDDSPERRQVVQSLELAILEVFAEIKESPDFKDSQASMRNRSFLGFVVSPGLVLSAYALGDFLVLVGSGVNFVQYVLPRELWSFGRQIVHWSHLQWALRAEKPEAVNSCRNRLRRLQEIRRGHRRSFVRGAQRSIRRWQIRLHPTRLTAYTALGAGLSLWLYNKPIPGLTYLSFEDQHDWDAQEDALKEILVPYFANIP